MPPVKHVTLRYNGPQALIVELGREVVGGDEFDAPEDLVDKLCMAHGVEVVGGAKTPPERPAPVTTEGRGE